MQRAPAAVSFVGLSIAALLLAVLPCRSASSQDNQGAQTVAILYLSRAEAEAPRASLLDPVSGGYGLQGARFGVQEINNSGRFLGRAYELIEAVVPRDGDVAAAARQAFAGGHFLIVADLEAADLLRIADLPEAADAVILDARTSDDSLRQGDCRDNVFHLLPNWAMRTDALSQYLARRSWKRWFLVKGTAPADEAYAAAAKRSAARFGATIVAEKAYDYRPDAEDASHGREQIQAQIPSATRTASDYDVLFVADTGDSFGDYLLFNTWSPRLVVGTHGLVAEAWDHQFREYAARGVLYRFFRAASREMTERDYGNWLATAVVGEAVTRGGVTEPTAVKAYILSDRFSVGANKGEGLTFRRWDHQLRQPVLLFGPRMLVALAPQADASRLKLQTDTLGFDRSQTECHKVR